MSNFNHFGVPSREWLDYETANGPVPTAPVSSVLPAEIQSMTNKAREQLSADQMKAEGLADKVIIKNLAIPTRDGKILPTRIYRSKFSTTSPLPVYLFFHGGGLIGGSISSEDATCSRIAATVPIIIVHVCYRHTPQVRYPIPWFDAFDAFDWLVAHLQDLGGDPERLLVGGVSAGANLAAAVVLRNGELPDAKRVSIKAQLFFIPWLFIDPQYMYDVGGMAAEDASRVRCRDAPVLPGIVVDWFVDLLRIGERGDVEGCLPDARLCRSESVKRTPPTVVVAAGRDPLRDDGLVYAQCLHQGGIPTKAHVFSGLPHGFRTFKQLNATKRYDALIVECFNWALADGKGSDTPFSIQVEPIEK